MRSILVTGGNQGIGYALCKQLATEHNCHVYLTARNADRGNEAVSNIRKLGGSADFIQLDVSSESSIQTAASVAREKLSSSDKHQSLYGIVNNAGIGVNTASSGDVIKTNLYGTKLMCDNFIPLLDSNKGRIVNIGSGSGPSYVGGVRSKSDAKMLCAPDSNEMTLRAFNLADWTAFGLLGQGAREALDEQVAVGANAVVIEPSWMRISMIRREAPRTPLL